MAHMGWELENMVPAPAATATVRALITTEDGIMECYGTAAYTVLEAEANKYAPGCTYTQVVAAGPSVKYFNVGTSASPDFNVMTITG